MKSRQATLGFGSPAAPAAMWSTPRVASVSDAGRASRAAGAGPGLYDDGRGPRDWARELREQTRKARPAEPSVEPRPGGPAPAASPAVRVAEAAAACLADAGAPGVDDRAPEAQLDAPDAARGDGGDGGDGGDSGDARAARPPRVASIAEGSGPVAAHGYFARLRYLGQIDLTYLACEGDGEMVLIDQHAAHERVELGRLRARHAGGGEPRVAVQNMLFPITLEATPAELALIPRVGELLAQVGFEVEPFGHATLAVKAVPAGIRHGDPAQLLRARLRAWAEDGAPSEAERLDALLGEIACHSVVRAGDRLSTGEAETLLRSLDGIDLSLPAPHGKAVLLRLPFTEIGRRFGR
jgi:DNA mismatch repair protein MutL